MQTNKYTYDVVVVLGGGFFKDDKGYHPTRYSDGDQFGMLGGMIRTKAAAALHIQQKANSFLFSTGVSEKQKEKFGPDVPAEGRVYRDDFLQELAELELSAQWGNQLKDLGAPVTYLEEISVNTATNLKEVTDMIVQHGWKRVAVVSSDYHIPRIAALWKMYCEKKGPELETVFLPAEGVVTELWPECSVEIHNAYQSEAALERIRNEQKGLKDIEEGKYVFSEFQLAAPRIGE